MATPSNSNDVYDTVGPPTLNESNIIIASTIGHDTIDESNDSELHSELTNDSNSECKEQQDRETLACSMDFMSVMSFINQFGVFLKLKKYGFDELEAVVMNSSTEKINPELIELHLCLLRRAHNKSARANRFTEELVDFCKSNDCDDVATALIKSGYKELDIEHRMQILRLLCESQFENSSSTFAKSVSEVMNSKLLRLLPIGTDIDGNQYMYQQDHKFNFRLYQISAKANYMKTVAVDTESLNTLVDELKKKCPADGFYEFDEDVARQFGFLAEDENGCPVFVLKSGTLIDEYRSEEAKKILTEQNNEKKLSRKQKRQLAAAIQVKKRGRRRRRRSISSESDSDVASFVNVTPEKAVVKEEKQASDEEQKAGITEDGRRILPRRSARANAQVNLQKFIKKDPATKVLKKAGKTKAAKEAGSDFDSENEKKTKDTDFKLEPKVNNRKRKIRQRKNEDTLEEEEEESEEEEVIIERKTVKPGSYCLTCYNDENPDVLLLCDICDSAYHTFCLVPKLSCVPHGNWFCPRCEHTLLVRNLVAANEHRITRRAQWEIDEKKRKATSRLEREMATIDCIVPLSIPKANINDKSDDEYDSEDLEDEDEEDTRRRKSKTRAKRRIAPSLRRVFIPVQTITESRAKRRTARAVDYSFADYESMIKEAVEDETAVPLREDDPRPTGGMGSKDMANIIKAEEERQKNAGDKEPNDEDAENDEEDDAEGGENRNVGRPALSSAARSRKHRRKLTNLESDGEQEESDISEYKEDEASENEDFALPSDDSELQIKRRSRRARRASSSDEFVVSDSDPDYEYSTKKSKKRKRTRYSDDDDSDYGRKKKRQRVRYESEDDADQPRNASGRRMRQAAAKANENRKKIILEDDSEEDVEINVANTDNVVPKSARRRINSDSSSYSAKEDAEEEDDEEEEVVDDEEDDEEMYEDDSDSAVSPRKSVKRGIIPEGERRAPPPKPGLNKSFENDETSSNCVDNKPQQQDDFNLQLDMKSQEQTDIKPQEPQEQMDLKPEEQMDFEPQEQIKPQEEQADMKQQEKISERVPPVAMLTQENIVSSTSDMLESTSYSHNAQSTNPFITAGQKSIADLQHVNPPTIILTDVNDKETTAKIDEVVTEQRQIQTQLAAPPELPVNCDVPSESHDSHNLSSALFSAMDL